MKFSTLQKLTNSIPQLRCLVPLPQDTLCIKIAKIATGIFAISLASVVAWASYHYLKNKDCSRLTGHSSSPLEISLECCPPDLQEPFKFNDKDRGQFVVGELSGLIGNDGFREYSGHFKNSNGAPFVYCRAPGETTDPALIIYENDFNVVVDVQCDDLPLQLKEYTLGACRMNGLLKKGNKVCLPSPLFLGKQDGDVIEFYVDDLKVSFTLQAGFTKYFSFIKECCEGLKGIEPFCFGLAPSKTSPGEQPWVLRPGTRLNDKMFPGVKSTLSSLERVPKGSLEEEGYYSYDFANNRFCLCNQVAYDKHCEVNRIQNKKNIPYRLDDTGFSFDVPGGRGGENLVIIANEEGGLWITLDRRIGASNSVSVELNTFADASVLFIPEIKFLNYRFSYEYGVLKATSPVSLFDKYLQERIDAIS